jgi:hypothetical protein
MSAGSRLTNSLKDVLELEQFLHAFISTLTKRRPRAGEDVTHLVKELGLKLPAALEGGPILWVGREEEPSAQEENKGQTLVLVRPGNANALGFTIGCITIHGRRYCLECGWLYCRIVIKF